MTNATDSAVLPLVVVVGAPALRTEWSLERSLLVVEANLERVRQINHELGGNPDGVMVCAEVLTEEDGIPVEWNLFNDPRFDGPVGLAAWQQSYPNLRLLAQQQRSGRRLGNLVEMWVKQHALDQNLQLDLEVRQGDPLAALIGLGNWLASLQSVRLDMPTATVDWLPDLEAWLERRGFRAAKDTALTWYRDPVEALQFSIQQNKKQVTLLESQLLEVMNQRDQQQARADKLESKINQIDHEIDGFLALIYQGQQETVLDFVPGESGDE